jgi:hypothetical protein
MLFKAKSQAFTEHKVIFGYMGVSERKDVWLNAMTKDK